MTDFQMQKELANDVFKRQEAAAQRIQDIRRFAVERAQDLEEFNARVKGFTEISINSTLARAELITAYILNGPSVKIQQNIQDTNTQGDTDTNVIV